jgi:ABC-type polysaccharide transport system permease subunit
MAVTTWVRRGANRAETDTPTRSRGHDDTRIAILFILPALIGYLVFMVWPTLRGIYLSFTQFNLLTPPEFNGLDNYVRMVQDPVFWNAMRVTLYYVVLNIGFQTVFAPWRRRPSRRWASSPTSRPGTTTSGR